MAIFLKKNRLGILSETTDSDWTTVQLADKEYLALRRRIQDAEKATEDIRDKSYEAERQLRQEMTHQIAKVQEAAEKEAAEKNSAAQATEKAAMERIVQVEAEAKKLREELAAQRNLNTNLKRIMTERANAARGLTPKKALSGYVVLSSSQYKQRYRRDKTTEERKAWEADHPFTARSEYIDHESCIASVWQTQIQTPYDAGLPLESIEDDIWTELTLTILPALGCENCQSRNDNGVFHVWRGTDGKETNGVYRWYYKANYLTGLWEVTILHTKELSVAAEYRPEMR